MRRIVPTVLLVGSLGLSSTLSGCAVLLTRSPSQLHVAVEDPQENVDVLIAPAATGPIIRRKVPFFTVSLDGRSDYTLKVRSPGYKTYETTLTRQVRPAVWGDVLLLGLGAYGVGYGLTQPDATLDALGNVPVLTLGVGTAALGILGLGWGAVTGSMWRHRPSNLVVTLDKEPARPLWPFW